MSKSAVIINKVDFDAKYENMKSKLDRLEVLKTLYSKIEDAMNWDLRKYHPADDEHESSWFTDYEEEGEDHSWAYERMVREMPVYQEVLDAIAALADK